MMMMIDGIHVQLKYWWYKWQAKRKGNALVLQELRPVDGLLVDPVRHAERLHERACMCKQERGCQFLPSVNPWEIFGGHAPPFSRSFCLGFRKEKRSRKAVSVKSCSGLPW